MTEPVATLPAVCVECKHERFGEGDVCTYIPDPASGIICGHRCRRYGVSAPEAGGEPELLPEQVVAMIKESVNCEYNDLVGYKARLGAALVDLKLLLNSRVSQPADEPSDEEFNPWYENYEKALVAEVSSPTLADEEVAREIPRICVHCDEPIMVVHAASHIAECYESHLNYERAEDTITTALAEARRAGTPTTDARAKSVVDHLFTILARDYNIELTNNDASEMAETVASALSSTPSDAIITELKRVEPGAANYDAVPLEERVRRVVNRLINASTPSEQKENNDDC